MKAYEITKILEEYGQFIQIFPREGGLLFSVVDDSVDASADFEVSEEREINEVFENIMGLYIK